jgi:hypothetical protein
MEGIIEKDDKETSQFSPDQQMSNFEKVANLFIKYISI